MNFNQWKNFVSKGSIPKLIYCCGDQPALVELVVQDIKKTLQVPSTDFLEIDARNDSYVWDKASQYPLDPDNSRLIIIRNAESFTGWNDLTSWLTYIRSNSNHVVFVSNEADAPSVYSKGKRVSYAEHIEIIRSKGKFIKCSQPNDEDLVKWAQTYGLIKSTAEFLVERTSGDTNSMLNVLQKVHVWDGSPSPKALELLCDEQALDSFADYLILKDKKLAYMSLSTMSEYDKSKIVAHLNYRLDTMMEISRCVRKRMYATDIAATTGIKVFLVKKLMPVSKDYNDNKIRYCRQVLAMVDSALGNGVKVGLWETLIALW